MPFVTAAEWTPPKRAQVVVIGSGAGGAVVAARLATAGFEVVVLEEGGHYQKRNFRMREDEAFPQLYQESGTRATKDLGISILQGRAVGGSTVINWTTSFRTPDAVLEHWAKVHGVREFGPADLRPHFEAVEARLNIQPIPLEESNRNNRLLWDGCEKLGYAIEVTKRNVKNCFRSGYCGMGCPVDAKQSMLVTYLPEAVEHGATVVSRCRVDRLRTEGDRVVAVECSELTEAGPTGRQLSLAADRVVLAGGAINTPAVLLRSGLKDPFTGRRTFLHPVVATSARFREPVRAFYGAPQSVASHHFAHRGDRAGFFLEAAPAHPMMLALAATGFGEAHRSTMVELPHLSAHLAIAVDGFSPEETGGTVELRPSGAPVLDYVLPPRIWEALGEGLRTLVRVDLAAGAEWVQTGHDPALRISSEGALASLEEHPLGPGKVAVFSAHVMGGAMVGEPGRSVVRSGDLRHHRLQNLHISDGSIFPTSLGVNPQETIYGIAHLVSERWAQSWKS